MSIRQLTDTMNKHRGSTLEEWLKEEGLLDMTKDQEVAPGYRAECIKATELVYNCLKAHNINLSIGTCAMMSVILGSFDSKNIPWEDVEKVILEILEEAKPQYGKCKYEGDSQN